MSVPTAGMSDVRLQPLPKASSCLEAVRVPIADGVQTLRPLGKISSFTMFSFSSLYKKINY